MEKIIACCVSFPGPNAISVSLSPMGRYVMVGLASRRILLHPSTEHMVAQVFRLQQPHGGETSMRVSDDSLHLQTSVSVPTISLIVWLDYNVLASLMGV